MHEPVGRVHLVVFEKFKIASAYSFQIAPEKSYDYLLNNNKFWQRARF